VEGTPIVSRAWSFACIIDSVMEQVIPQFSGRMSEQEYLLFEETATTKHEYRDGQVVDMAGSTFDHVAIASNLIGRLMEHLVGKPCKPYGSDLRVRVSESGNYCYPDVTVICGPPSFSHADRRTTVTNPRVIIEVTSGSTESDDRGRKFNDYRRLASLEEYILVAQDRASVETFYRQPNGVWAIGPTFAQTDASVPFRSLSIEIPLAEIYAGVEFPLAAEANPPTKAE
jgi:Uma2 family endonuclease